MERARLRVVVVDDDEDVQEMVRIALPGDLIELVGTARDGEQALRIVGEAQPDIVIMDLFMPVMDGAEATKRIKSTWPHIGVIGFTSADTAGLERLLQAGAVAVFEKENFKQLVEALRGYEAEGP